MEFYSIEIAYYIYIYIYIKQAIHVQKDQWKK